MEGGELMVKFILKRIGYMIVTLWVVITITFFLMNTLPGSPIESGAKRLPEQVRINMMHKWGLDLPVYQRYGVYLKNLLKGNLGESITTPGLSASSIIHDKFPASARLGLQAILLGLTVGLILGILAAFKRSTWVDYLVMVIAIIGVSVPSFVVASLLQKILGGGILPIIGWPSENVWFSGFKYTILPTIALSFGNIAIFARYMRTSVLDTLGQDYILTAEAKGISSFSIVVKHIIRNSIIPIVTILGPQIAGIITGSFVIERIFSIPGLGQYFVESITGRDYLMIMATTLFYSFLFIASLLIVDILYVAVDPRIKLVNNSK
jgi:oligopeptide transport system permease protein